LEKTVQLLKDLTALPGIPGHEEAVAKYMLEYEGVKAVSRRTDPSGNVWIRTGGPEGSPPIVLLAHIDEVGFRVKRIEEDGRLSILGHERMDLRALGSEVVQVWTRTGTISAFVVTGQETTLPKDYAGMTPDRVRLEIGARTRGEAEELGVDTGDVVTFDPSCHRLGNGLLCAKAFDDRSGVASILLAAHLSQGKRAHPLVLLGTVQEEIGAHGADAVEFEEKPGALISVDICGGEVYSLPEPDRRGILGKGPILHDGPDGSQGMIRRLLELGAERSIPVQRYVAMGRGADLSNLQKKCGGLPALNVILPMAYYHGPRGLIQPRDVLNAGRLLAAALEDPEFLEHTGKW